MPGKLRSDVYICPVFVMYRQYAKYGPALPMLPVISFSPLWVPETPKILTPSAMFSALRFASPATLISPVVYLPDATAICSVVVGVTVLAPCVVSCCVADLVPAVTMPPLCVAEAVISPPDDTEIVGTACCTSASAPLTTEPSAPTSCLPLRRSSAAPGDISAGSGRRAVLCITPHRLPERGSAEGNIIASCCAAHHVHHGKRHCVCLEGHFRI